MGAKKIDYSLYLCTDRALLKGITLEKCVESAIKGGVTVVQLREKDASSREFYDMGIKIKAITDRYGVPLIINDRVDIALAVDADGVHLGQSDLSPVVARRLMGGKIIGVTAHNRAEALAAQDAGADYIGVGAMFSTGTKKDAKVIDRAELDAVRAAVKLPTVLIGGINRDNVRALKGKGDGIAVVSAIMVASDPEGAARELKELWK